MTKIINILAAISIIISNLTSYAKGSDNMDEQNYGCIRLEDKNELAILSPRLQNIAIEKWKTSEGMSVFLIHDPEASQSGIAFITKVGSGDDPFDTKGCAHFIEHLVAGRGNEKYPNFGIEEFIIGQGGIYNASTYMDKTSYMFSVPNHTFEEAVDRFASMLSCPLFSDEDSTVEINAIDEESKMAKMHDGHRVWSSTIETFSSDHQAKGYFPGDKNSLKYAKNAMLKNWFEEHYTSVGSSFIVLSSLPMDQLRETVLPKATQIPKRKSWERPNLGTAIDKSVFRFVETVQGTNCLQIVWEMPPLNMPHVQFPHNIITHILNLANKNSLSHLLKENGLAEGIECELYAMTTNMPSLLIVEIKLTDKGVTNWTQVLSEVMAAISKISNSEDLDKLISDISTSSVLNYQYSNRSSVFETISRLTVYLSTEDLETFPTLSIKPSHQITSEQVKQAALDMLKQPVSVVLGTSFNSWQKSNDNIEKPTNKDELPLQPLWDYPYFESSVPVLPPSELCNNLNIMQSFRFLPKTTPGPTLTYTDNNFHVTPEISNSSFVKSIIHVKDKHFGIPKTLAKAKILPEILSTPNEKNHFLTEVWTRILNKKICTLQNEAALGHNRFIASAKTPHNIILSIEAWNESLIILLKEICEFIKSDFEDEKTLNRVLEEIKHEITGLEQAQPYATAIRLLREHLNVCEPSLETMKKLVESITINDVIEIGRQIRDNSRVDLCSFGNLTQEQIQQITQSLNIAFTSRPELELTEVQAPVVEIGQHSIKISSELIGHGVLLAMDCGSSRNPQDMVFGWILSKGMHPVVSELREKQGLAYVVASLMREINNRVIVLFIIQSKTCHSDIIKEKYEDIITTTLASLGTAKYFSHDKLESLKKSCRDVLSSPPSSSQDFLSRIYDFAFLRGSNWMFTKEAIEATNFDDSEFFDFCRKVLHKNSSRRLFISVEGEQETNS